MQKAALRVGNNYLGSDPQQCSVVIQDGSVSAVHANISIEEPSDYSLEDVSLKGGIYKTAPNNISLKLKVNKLYELQDGNEFNISDFRLVFSVKDFPVSEP